jgi:hypothetical protein
MINAWKDVFRLLFFRFSHDDFANLGFKHLQVGLICTWLVGMGRYWDDPRAVFLQKLGVGSLVYIILLAGFLWIIGALLRPEHWNYQHVLTFVSMCSVPAVFYAIPVERFFTMEVASHINVWFLAVVAAWRVCLLFSYFKTHAKFGVFTSMVTVFLPVTCIVSALTVLNLEHVVFRIMGGLRPEDRSANDYAYSILFLLTYFSIVAFVPLLVSYLVLIRRRYIHSKQG